MIARVIAMVFGVFFGLLGLVFDIMYLAGDESARASGSGPFVLCTIFLVIGVLLIRFGIKGRSSKQKPHIPDEYDPSTPLEEIPAPNLALRPGERCYIMEQVIAAKPKNVVTGYTGGSGGISVRVAKGVTLRSGSSKGRAVRQTVLEKYPGTLYITSQRVILNSMKYGFEKPIKNFSSFQLYKDGVNLTFGKETYLILTNRPKYIAGNIRRIATVLQGLTRV